MTASASPSGKDRSRPFPCMDSPCGCATAEQCFANCCCHSAAERVAWARSHGVEPAVLAALEHRAAPGDRAASATCCAASSPDCVERQDSCYEGDDICSDYRFSAAEPKTAAGGGSEKVSDASQGGRVISLRAMLACGGVSAGWTAVVVSLPPPPPTVASVNLACLGRIVLADEWPRAIVSPLDPPPPRA